MSTNSRFAIDELVYPAGTSGNRIGVVRGYGVVTAFHGHQIPAVDVEWHDGKRELIDEGHVWPADLLIDDHLVKLNNHLERRNRAARKLGVPERANGPVQL